MGTETLNTQLTFPYRWFTPMFYLLLPQVSAADGLLLCSTTSQCRRWFLLCSTTSQCRRWFTALFYQKSVPQMVYCFVLPEVSAADGLLLCSTRSEGRRWFTALSHVVQPEVNATDGLLLCPTLSSQKSIPQTVPAANNQRSCMETCRHKHCSRHGPV